MTTMSQKTKKTKKNEEDQEDAENATPIGYNFNCENAIKDSIFCVNYLPRKT